MASQETEFMSGVIEGFYGQPWSQAERMELFDDLAGGGLNTYVYAPKDDLKHRALWREPYTTTEAAGLGELIRAAQARNLRFVYALSPGLDIAYADEVDFAHLKQRCAQMLSLGCEHFALLFDDIPDHLAPADASRFGSFAAAQCQVVNALFRWVRERAPQGRVLFCPTAYCGRMAARHLGGEGYLAHVGRELLPDIDVFWTGPEIVSAEIGVAPVRELQALLRRKPVIWDNLFANDYDGRRFYCGPYAGRPTELRAEVGGLLINPNNEHALNFVPRRTLAEFIRVARNWDARAAYLSALKAWLPQFATLRGSIQLDDLVLLGDCFYLPHRDGAEAEALYDGASELVHGNRPLTSGQVAAFRPAAIRLRDCCARLAELRNRPLFYALSRRIWELREELDLLLNFTEASLAGRSAASGFQSDFHLPGTYRGGMVPRLQHLLIQQPDGSFAPGAGREAKDHLSPL